MTTEILYQILLVVLIVAGLFLIVALWRLIDVLSDLKKVSNIISKRAAEIDTYVGNILSSFKETADMIKGFLYSFDIIRAIREKYLEAKNKDNR
jgi:uncharacterized membrane-anchored protein YhcB (DUF1043 family)